MTPRKKRSRYRETASRIAQEQGLELDEKDWEAVWTLLDLYGEESYVYAIVDEEASAVKFGKSVNPGQRLKALQTANGRPLALWAYCTEGKAFNERAIHKRMSQYRISGEWFHLNEETRNLIDRMQAVAFCES
jgi:hypothetical protein